MRFAWFVVAIFAGRFFATALYFPASDGDLGWQRWLGHAIVANAAMPERLGHETFTAEGARWVPQEWLFSLAAYASGTHAWFWLAASCAGCATLALALCGWRAQRLGASPAGVAFASGAAGIALLASFGVRVQVLGWPFLAAFLLLLESDGPAAYGAVAVTALWSNVHASVMLAPVLAAIFCMGSALDRGWTARTRRYALVAAGCAAATCANPLGWKLPLYAVTLFSSPFKALISEWKPTNLGDAAFAYGALPLLLCVLAFGINGNDRWRDRLLLGAVAWLMFSAARNVPVFALVAAPLAAVALSSGFSFAFAARRAAPPVRSRRLRTFEACGAVVLAFTVGGALVRAEASGLAPDTQPRAALASIVRLPGRQNVLCADFAWCSYLLGTPRARVFLDGRADPYPQAVWNDFATIVHVHEHWQEKLNARAVDVVLVERSAPLEQALQLAPGWRTAYSDARYRVWVRAKR